MIYGQWVFMPGRWFNPLLGGVAGVVLNNPIEVRPAGVGLQIDLRSMGCFTTMVQREHGVHKED